MFRPNLPFLLAAQPKALSQQLAEPHTFSLRFSLSAESSRAPSKLQCNVNTAKVPAARSEHAPMMFL
ncbi:hypothetical protein XELAEV_18020577mg [Xenopus laevis]|uniref:Uncharacterized protein n=1 Tax=Xenopus laevis TaxID=8355 RepID=A0A974D819_XENLA|nr:hypothetical protein XELAEV_18020577mg [Xenopus laevis]